MLGAVTGIILHRDQNGKRKFLCQCSICEPRIDNFTVQHKKLSYRRGTARRAMPVEILSAAAQLNENHISKRLQQRNDLEGHPRLSKLHPFDMPYRIIYTIKDGLQYQ